ncbi:MAG: monovalent cation/H(+) antiporter subunit G [Pseudomonadota bacterium]
MLDTVAEIVATLSLIAGGLLCFSAGLGVVRFQDVFLRMHAATKAGTLGLMFIVLALCVVLPETDAIIKAILVAVFMVMTAPIASHLIGRAAFRTRSPFWEGTKVDQGCEVFRAAQQRLPTDGRD